MTILNTNGKLMRESEERVYNQLRALRVEARELESMLKDKRGNRELVKRELFSVRSIISEVTS